MLQNAEICCFARLKYYVDRLKFHTHTLVNNVMTSRALRQSRLALLFVRVVVVRLKVELVGRWPRTRARLLIAVDLVVLDFKVRVTVQLAQLEQAAVVTRDLEVLRQLDIGGWFSKTCVPPLTANSDASPAKLIPKQNVMQVPRN
jgi:hypothetical protein